MNRSNLVFLLCMAHFLNGTAQDANLKVQVFLPGIVSTDANEFNACFSADGKSFYFSRTTGNRTVIYVTHELNRSWSEPQPLSFCDDGFSYADPAFSPEGLLYFISNRPVNKEDSVKDFDIWQTSCHGGQWDDPVNVTILNSPQDEYYVSFSRKGDVYFSSSRRGGYGEEDIYMAKSGMGGYERPVNMGPAVNTVYSEYDPWISPDGSILIFTSNGRNDSFGKADLYWIEKVNDGGNVHHFGPAINTPARDFCPYLDGNDQFFLQQRGTGYNNFFERLFGGTKTTLTMA